MRSPVTPPAERERLAQQHRQFVEQSHRRSQRQQARLQLLRLAARRYRGQPPAADPPRRILLIRPDHLGDLLFTTPALHYLRRQWPAAEISALVGPWGEAVLAGNPDVDNVLTLPFPGFTRQPKAGPLAPYRLLQDQAGRLRPMQFDLALVLRFDHWWGAWLAAAAGIPRRTGYDIAEVAPFLTQTVAYVPGRHEVLQNVGLALAAAGQARGQATDSNSAHLATTPETKAAEAVDGDTWKLRFAISAADETAAGELLAPLGAGRRIVAIHPGSGAAVKRWRSEAWAGLAQSLVEQADVQIVLTGSAGEAELIEPIRRALGQAAPAVSLAGQTNLGSLAAVYRRCALVVGPDSGPLHLAVAAGTPTVHLFGPVDRRTFGPWGSARHHRTILSDWRCIPCNRLDWPDGALSRHGCVHDISLDQVLANALDLLQPAS